MSRLFVTVSGMQRAASQAAAAAKQIHSHIGTVDELVNGLESSFEGQAADEYQAKIDEWVAQATKVDEALAGLGKFLDAAAEAVQQVDAQLAAALKGGGGAAGPSDQITADSGFLSALANRTGNIAGALHAAESMFTGAGFESGKIEGALESFRKDWSDARERMVTSLEAARDMANQASQVFADTDAQLMQAISS
jgi:WXG100 family type VII secretion target